ncbi:polyhydroxybutyrate depolymerase [Panacagrimonas perspica]|uniref:Polyhydroxybutyrate depolymerase n=1 Tax=Panacagrimonas perspica TaxID=381431 RepID=A0A4S3K870_9GAMM|nr:PHB depolymerase family esterase [Panacagrimonas perspica]TDU32051.1 polyhydroxybutyrate depolymerase [Panacagrimonas perspica]THD04419.1 hypothetical protein B1810_05280 [Panacagrimonas perspica]
MSIRLRNFRRDSVRPLLGVLALLLAALLVPLPAQAAGSVASGTLKIGGMDRTYRLYVPSGYSTQKPAPLVVAMHGGLGTGEIFASQSGLDAVAEKNGFLALYPDGYKRGWNAGTCCGPPMNEKVDDVGFIKALVGEVGRKYSVDAGRVYGTGFSNGAMLAHRIACEAPDVFVAIAPVSGGLMTGSCASKQPVSALLIGGLLDKNIPWDGGTYDGTYRPSVKELVSSLSSRDGCSDKEKVTSSGPGFECRTREACQGRTEVSWCRLDTVGHQWAGGKTYMRWLLGPNTETFNASEKVWTFFNQHQRADSAARRTP